MPLSNGTLMRAAAVLKTCLGLYARARLFVKTELRPPDNTFMLSVSLSSRDLWSGMALACAPPYTSALLDSPSQHVGTPCAVLADPADLFNDWYQASPAAPLRDSLLLVASLSGSTCPSIAQTVPGIQPKAAADSVSAARSTTQAEEAEWQRAHQLAESCPVQYVCPISLELMQDPVILVRSLLVLARCSRPCSI